MAATSPHRVKYEPYWWEAAGPPASPASTALPGEADVVIIGAGHTGLSAARTLAKNGQHVVVLDAGAPGIGASSRNGGQVGGGHRLTLEELEARYGPKTAQQLMYEALIASNDFLTGLLSEERIDCDYVRSGRFRALWTTAEYEETAASLSRLQKIVAVEAEMISRARQHEEIASDLYAGGTVFYSHGAFNPAKFVAGLLAAALKAGAQVRGDTPVLSIVKEGSRHTVATPHGSVRAGAVLAATNGYTPGFLSYANRRLIPVPSFIVVTEPLGVDRMSRLIPKGRVIAETRVRHCYFRPSPDGERLIFGGRAAMVDVPEKFAASQLKKIMTGIFPELRGVAITHSWRGNTGFTFDFNPHVGCHDGIWVAMGYSGNGNTMAPYLGHKAALSMLGDAEGETAFRKTEFSTRWWHRGRPWFMPFADLVFRANDLRDNWRRKH